MEFSSVTVSIISPPLKNGGRDSNILSDPQSTPMPVGPNILCPEKVIKSQPRFCTSTGMCDTLCAASTMNMASIFLVISDILSIGLIEPSTLDIWVRETTFVFEVK